MRLSGGQKVHLKVTECNTIPPITVYALFDLRFLPSLAQPRTSLVKRMDPGYNLIDQHMYSSWKIVEDA